jgi:hypothetical protein
MKTITIRLSDVEAAMLVEVQKKKKDYRDLSKLLGQKISDEYRVVAGSGWSSK